MQGYRTKGSREFYYTEEELRNKKAIKNAADNYLLNRKDPSMTVSVREASTGTKESSGWLQEESPATKESLNQILQILEAAVKVQEEILENAGKRTLVSTDLPGLTEDLDVRDSDVRITGDTMAVLEEYNQS